MTSSGISCATEGCKYPVIGQCTGYEGKCLRYYCKEHSQGTLCNECSKKKNTEELIIKISNNYGALAEGLQKEQVIIPAFHFKNNFFVGLTIVSLVIALFLKSTSNDLWIWLCTIVFFCMPIFFFFIFRQTDRLIWIKKEESKARRKIAKRMEPQNPGFFRFWIEFSNNKDYGQSESLTRENQTTIIRELLLAGIISDN